MSPIGNPIATVGHGEAIGRGGKTIKPKARKKHTSIKSTKGTKPSTTYSTELRSRFGEAFLPFASKLESVEKTRVERKRRGHNVRKQPMEITKEPNYGEDQERRSADYIKNKVRNNDKLGKKTDSIKEATNNTMVDKLNWEGDTMTFEEGWPNTGERRTLRIFHINLNGVTYQNDYLEWEMTVAFLMDMQIDIFGLTEINLDLKNGIVKDNFVQAAKHFDPYLRLTSSSSLQTVGTTPFKMGGTVTGSNGCWSGRISRQGEDQLGRWSYMALQAKKGYEVVFITVYLPNKPTTAGGGTTIYKQMEADLLKRKGKLIEPRKALLDDLHSFIDNERKTGNVVILMGDMNDNLGMENGQVRTFLKSVGMEMTFNKRHGDTAKLPPTHDRGKNCLDLIGISDHIPDTAIVKAGYAPFYFNFFTDHRGVFVDIDVEEIFNCERPDTTKQIYKRFTTIQVPKCSRYLRKLEELMEHSKMFKKVDELEIKYTEYIKDNKKQDRNSLIEITKGLFQQVTEFMKCAEKSAGPVPYRDGFPDSPLLRQAAFKVIRMKKYLRMVSLGTILTEEKEKEKVVNDLKKAQLALRDKQKSANMIRQHHMEILADKRCHQWQMSSAEALHIIKESEKSKKLHGKHRRLINSSNEGTLRSLMVPAPITGFKNDIKDHRLYTNITDSNLMFNFLLKRNFDHLMQSKDAMFTKGPLLEKCGWYGEESGMEDLLRGLLDTDTMAKEYPEFGKEGIEFLRALRYKKTEEGKQVEPFTWKFGVVEYLEVFNKTKESTACGPSGIHMSHWKAACERTSIARVHAFFMWAAFELGFTYKRWEQSWHCMIKKLKQPLLPKLRIVQLFEGDFNAGLKYLIGKKMMTHMNEIGLHDNETFGSRTGKTAPEALMNLQLLFDHNRLWKLPIAILFNDAIGCYDRIIPTLCELAMRARGCPRGIAQCHTQTQKNMIHRIRIATGISEGIIKFALTNMKVTVEKTILCLQGKTGGIGQGGGAGPLAWIAVIDVMLEAYRELRPGAEAIDPMQLYTICYWLISYVDDNTIVVGFKDETDQNTILTTIRENLGSWRRLLQLTGGDIDVSKSKWSTLRWRYDETWGDSKLETIKDFPGSVGMINENDGQENREILGRLEPNQAERVLGVRLPMDGSMRIEFTFRCKQIRDFSRKVYNAPLNHWDSWVIYESRYRAIIRYPLPVTLFTESQCMAIQRPFIDAILPKIGINRKTPRTIIYGPKTYGGLEMMDLRVEQVSTQIETTRGHMRRLDRAGHGLFITANDMQVISGRSVPFYRLNPRDSEYMTEKTRWNYIWKQLFRIGLSLDIYNFWVPKLRSKNDRNIMDVAMKDEVIKKSKWKLLRHINQCRLYTKSFTIHDLTRDGVEVYGPYLDGSQRGVNIDIAVPEVRRPTDNQWRIWKSFLFRNFLSPGTRINPGLGELTRTNHRPTFPVSETDMILKIPRGESSLQELLDQLPTALEGMVGKVIIPADDGLAISEAIVGGYCLGASDGSLIQGFRTRRGSHGYALCTSNENNEMIEGFGPSPDSDSMSSTTTEHYGVIGLLVILHMVSKKYLLCRNECYDSVRILVDNKTVVERCNRPQEVINISDYAVPDQELWALMTELLRQLPIDVEMEWIKSHQDTNEFGERINGPFSQEVNMNIIVDKLATRGMEMRSERYLQRQNLYNAVLSIYNKDGVLINDVRRYMTETINGEAMLEYMEKRRGWEPKTIDMIEWEGIEGMMRSANPMKRIKLLKMLHNWQNTGSQKGRIRDSRLKLHSDSPLEPTEEEASCHLCPAGCKEVENELHYLHCPDATAKSDRYDLITKVLKKLKLLHTYEGITTMVRIILTRISNRDDETFNTEELSNDGNLCLKRTIRGQDKIGWFEFCQGYCHKGWAIIQNRYYRLNGLNTRKCNIERWKKLLCTVLGEYCLDCWQARNESLHGKEREETKKLQLKKARSKVKSLYGKKEELRGTTNFKIFDMPLYKRIRFGVQSITLWIGMAEEVLRLHRENVAKNTLHHWLQP